MRRHQGSVGLLGGDILGQLEMHRPGPLFDATRNASRTMVGMEAGETICRVIFVSGRMAPTISTIWNRACRALLIAFWPVIISIGMAPRWA